ncbi:hypothetical protein ZWY2020_014160 [Hordeum vulgare]|nr:hypothetical protein ZWY2020_014160 [Hordeum vulgare]
METLVISQQRSHHHHHSGRRRSHPALLVASAHAWLPRLQLPCLPLQYQHRHPAVPPPPQPACTQARTYSPEPKTPKQQLHNGKKRSRAIPITPSGSPPSRPELWAGPAYSNSPPPSSLPIPKFSLHQKRSVSLELPPADRTEHVEVLVHAKSAPSTPTAGSGFGFFGENDTAIATENLRRILNLEITED